MDAYTSTRYSKLSHKGLNWPFLVAFVPNSHLIYFTPKSKIQDCSADIIKNSVAISSLTKLLVESSLRGRRTASKCNKWWPLCSMKLKDIAPSPLKDKWLNLPIKSGPGNFWWFLKFFYSRFPLACWKPCYIMLRMVTCRMAIPTITTCMPAMSYKRPITLSRRRASR